MDKAPVKKTGHTWQWLSLTKKLMKRIIKQMKTNHTKINTQKQNPFGCTGSNSEGKPFTRLHKSSREFGWCIYCIHYSHTPICTEMQCKWIIIIIIMMMMNDHLSTLLAGSVRTFATSLSHIVSNRKLNPAIIHLLSVKEKKKEKKRWIESSTHSHTQAGLIPNTSPQLTGLALQYL